MRVLEEDCGTSSLSVARSHNVPFLMFGPEMWVRECHSGDACSAPISVDGQNRYFLSMFSLDQNDLPYDILLSLLMTMKYSVENYLKMIEYWKVCNIISEDIPAAIFWVNRDGSLRYANDRARLRMDEGARMEDVFLNYEHIPVQKGFDGKKTIRKEITWITQDRTYEDVTSVLPVYNSGRVDSVVVITMSIEDLKTTIAHATGYSSRYSLYSMVGNSSEFQALQHKAARVARGDNNILLQGRTVRASSVLPRYPSGKSTGCGSAHYGARSRRTGRGTGRRIFWQDRWYGPSGSGSLELGQLGERFP